MTNDKLAAAVDRYRAMAGLIGKMPPALARKAREDRKKHGGRYVLQRRGRAVCDPVRMVRFLVNVCGLNMLEASKAVRAALRENKCGAWPAGRDVEAVAAEIYRRTKDMPDAMSMARFLGWASDQPQIWEHVRMHLSAMPVGRQAESTNTEEAKEAAL